MVNPIIANIVRRKQAMERYNWVTLILITLISCIIIVSNRGGQENSQILPDLGSALTEGTNDKTGGAEHKNLAPHGFVRTSSGVKCLSPLGKFKIIRDEDDFPSNISFKAALTVAADFHVDLSEGEGGYLPLGGGEGTGTKGLGYDDDDFGLPPRDIFESKPISPIGSWNTPEFPENRLPQGTFPLIILREESSTGPSLRFIPDSTCVFGWLYFQSNGWFRFEPLSPDQVAELIREGMIDPDFLPEHAPLGRHPDVSDRLQEYLTNEVVKAYASTPCKPAIVNGQVEEQRFPLVTFFNVGEDFIWSAGPSTKVIMIKNY